MVSEEAILKGFERPADRAAFERFLLIKKGRDNIKPRTVAKRADSLKAVSRLVDKPLLELSFNELLAVQVRIEEQETWVASTKSERRRDLKQFIKVLEGKNSSKLDALSYKKPEVVYKNPKLLPTLVEWRDLEARAKDVRLTALIEGGFWSCARPSELCAMRVRDVWYEDEAENVYAENEYRPGLLLTFGLPGTKTARANQKVVVYDPYAVQAFQQYRASYPRTDPDEFLWVGEDGKKPLTAFAFADELKRLGIRLNFPKKINPYQLRRAGGTHLQHNVFNNETKLKLHLRLSQNTKQLPSYCYVGRGDLIASFKAAYPAVNEQQEKARMQQELIDVLLKDEETIKETAMLIYAGTLKILDGCESFDEAQEFLKKGTLPAFVKQAIATGQPIEKWQDDGGSLNYDRKQGRCVKPQFKIHKTRPNFVEIIRAELRARQSHQTKTPSSQQRKRRAET